MSADLDQLQGTWNITSLEADGQMMPESALSGSNIVVRKNKFKSVGMGAVYEGRIEIDETKKPKTFDLIFTEGPEKGNRNLGIYKLTGGKWTLCFATRGSERPRKFETKPDTGIALETLERGARVAGPKSRAKPKEAPAEPVSTETPTLLEGEWAMVAAVFNGAPLDKNMVQWCKRITRGNVTTVVAGPQVMLKAAFTCVASSNPGCIDYVNLAGANKNKAQAGIFSLNGDMLEICMAEPGKPRPREFLSRSGDGRSYTTWRLVKR
jgi:uncharacterized protein (TIGR03067 family)